jgi:hypothetical protein
MQLGNNGWNYTHLSGAGTTTILAAVGATAASAAAGSANTGILGGIEINTAGTTVTVYDAASAVSGAQIAVYGAITGCFNIPKQLKTGLTVVIAGSADVTVMWA